MCLSNECKKKEPDADGIVFSTLALQEILLAAIKIFYEKR